MKITEGQLKQLIGESLKSILKEYYFDANELYEGIDEEWKNKGRFIFQQITKRLSLSIYNFIREMEESYKPYTKDDIRKYMAPGFAVLQRKHPTLQPKVLDNCIDYIINKEKNKLYCFNEDSSPVNEAKKPVRLKESELRNLIRESVVSVLNEIEIPSQRFQ